jgi:citrate synthase
MEEIKERFKAKADTVSAEIKQMLKEHGSKVIGEVTLAQIYQGMRGITGLVTETSLLDSTEGIRFRGYSIPELKDKLPKAKGGNEPLPEALFHLMLLGELPSAEEAELITSTLQRRSHVPNYVFDTIEALPVTSHPMTMFVVGIMALQNGSHFAKAYGEGMNKKNYWDATFDDSLDFIARLPKKWLSVLNEHIKDVNTNGWGQEDTKKLLEFFCSLNIKNSIIPIGLNDFSVSCNLRPVYTVSVT